MNNIDWPLGSASGCFLHPCPWCPCLPWYWKIRSLDGAQKIECVPLYLLGCQLLCGTSPSQRIFAPNHAWLGPWAWCLILAPVPVRDVRKPAMHHTALRTGRDRSPPEPQGLGVKLSGHSPEDLDLRRLRIESIFRCARPQQRPPPSLASLALRHCHCTLEFVVEGASLTSIRNSSSGFRHKLN